MGFENIAEALASIKGIGFSAGDVGYYLALAGISILLLAGLFIGGVIVYRGLRSIGEMEPGQFAKFMVISAVVLLFLGALLP